MDSLMCLGPIRSTVVTDLHLRESDIHASLSGLAHHTATPSPCLLAAVGADKSGALAILRRGVVADVITAVPNLSAHGAWTLHYRPTVDDTAPAAEAAVAEAGAEGGADGKQETAAAGAAAAGEGGADGAAGVDSVGQQGQNGGDAQPNGDAAAADGSSSPKQEEGSLQQGGAEGENGGGDAEMADAAAAAAEGGGAAAAEAAGTKVADAAGAGGAAGANAGSTGATNSAAEAQRAAAAAAGSSHDDIQSSHHAFLLLSCGGSQTMVLDARGSELAEVTTDVSRHCLNSGMGAATTGCWVCVVYCPSQDHVGSASETVANRLVLALHYSLGSRCR